MSVKVGQGQSSEKRASEIGQLEMLIGDLEEEQRCAQFLRDSSEEAYQALAVASA